ncbi:MAG: UDP-3-O-(3-hydroxymyristoyl)glucosamine N-acyltransferase [Pseudomonadota bacterium]
MKITLQTLAKTLDLAFRGDPDLELKAVSSLASAKPGDICFIQHPRYLSALDSSQCSLVIATPAIASQIEEKAVLISDNPQYSLAETLHQFQNQSQSGREAEIHPSAQISDKAIIGKHVSVGALAIIEAGAEIGEGTVIGPASIVGRNARVGNHCRLHSRVTLEHSVLLGNRCELHSGVVIGSDGFGLAEKAGKWLKIPQIGSVRIDDDVEIGANTTVDRGALDDTIIETGCKLDNQIQVAHNVRIGAHTAIAACVGIAGSADIGCYCRISGAAVVLGHLSVADHVTITAMSLVTKDIKQPGVYSSGTPLLDNKLWHRNNVRYKSLDQLAQRVAGLEKKSNAD